MLQSNDPKDLSRRVHRMKANVYPGIAVAWVGVSSWMAESASRSSLLAGRNVSVIHSGIDTEIFQPRDKASARRALHLPVERRVVLLGAHDLLSPYKGVQYSLEALRGLNADCVIATFGHGQIDATGVEAPVTHLGFVTGALEMAQVYSAADVVLATSVADAFGKTVAEAQCCGAPVVAFNDTGPRDIVEHRVTGYLASARDSGDVRVGLRYCLESRFDHGYISQRARDAFSIERCTEQYVELYRMALAAPSS